MNICICMKFVWNFRFKITFLYKFGENNSLPFCSEDGNLNMRCDDLESLKE